MNQRLLVLLGVTHITLLGGIWYRVATGHSVSDLLAMTLIILTASVYALWPIVQANKGKRYHLTFRIPLVVGAGLLLGQITILLRKALQEKPISWTQEFHGFAAIVVNVLALMLLVFALGRTRSRD